MYPETLLPQPLLFNAAFYATIALVYSAAIFIIDRVRPGTVVFTDTSSLRNSFSYVAICSWPVLLFGGLILIAVRVGANVRRQRRRRKRRSRSKSRSRSRSRSQTPVKTRRASSAPPSVIPPRADGSQAEPDKPTELVGRAKRHHSDYAAREAPRAVPPSTKLPGRPDSERDDDAKQSRRPRSRPGSHNSRVSSKRSKSSKSTSNTDLLPDGFVSVTRAQKAFAAMGFLWVSAGLAATAAVSALVFFGVHERLAKALSDLNNGSHVGFREWAIAFSAGGLSFLLYGVLALTTLFKFFKTVGRTPADMEVRTVSLDDGDARGMDVDIEVGNPYAQTNYADDSAAYGIDARAGNPGGDDADYDESDGDDSDEEESAGHGALESDAACVTDGSGDLKVDMEVEDWRSQYRRGAHLPYQADEQTVERMMRQLRDMGFTNPHQNIAALQASSFDLEIASDKLANAQL